MQYSFYYKDFLSSLINKKQQYLKLIKNNFFINLQNIDFFVVYLNDENESLNLYYLIKYTFGYRR